MSTYASDDQVPLFTPPDMEHVGFAQGVLRGWNPETFENVVEVRGGLLTNLPVAAGVEALTYQSGNVLMLSRWKLRSGRGAASYWIGMGGRVIFPGTGAAESTIAFMRTTLVKQIVDDLVAELLDSPAGRTLIDGIVEDLLVSPAGQALAAFVFGERFKAASAAATVTTSSASYVSLSGGPSASDVEVSDGGTMIVMVGCNGAVSSAVGLPDQAAAMSFQVSGASSVSPADGNAYILAHADLGQDSFVWSRSMAVARITGLNPGTHTVAARYRKMFGGGSVEFTNRTLIAIGL